MQTVAIVGLGYFSQFHLNAWDAHPDIRIAAVVDTDEALAQKVAADYKTAAFSDLAEMLEAVDPDFLDLVVPPATHAPLIKSALKTGRTIICQKPFGTSLEDAEAITAAAEAADTTLVIHENFRFQPWHRAAKRFLDSGRMGQIYSARFNLRPGDGRGSDAYLARQPSFQKMPRFLVQETAVHQFDTFRFLFGPVTSVYADLRQLNPVIAGEDAGVVILTHANGTVSTFDGNRLADHIAKDKRRTMGELVIEGDGGTLSLNGDGELWFRAFRSNTVEPVQITEPVDLSQFGGGCVRALIDHVVAATKTGATPENTAREYLETIRLVEAAYASAQKGTRISLT